MEWEKKLAEAAKIVPMDEDDEELEAGLSNKKRKLGEVVSHNKTEFKKLTEFFTENGTTLPQVSGVGCHV